MGTMDTWMRQKFSFFTSSWSCLKASTKWPVLGQGQGRDDGRVGARSEGESDVETRSRVESRCGKDKRERACMV
jgi:hypothetical protein